MPVDKTPAGEPATGKPISEKPTLLVMAAGMGSRYGGLKQIDPVTDKGEIIMDFSLYDAYMAGFERAVFVIRKDFEEEFRALIDERAGKRMETAFVYQEMEDLPEGHTVPEGRVKPWGTAHAALSARDVIKGPFAVINADDYYGPSAFHAIYDFLETAVDGDVSRYAMVGFQLAKTLTENGTVARGICDVSGDGYLNRVVERTKIMQRGEDVCYTEDDGETWIPLPEDSTVSMNFWGFTPSFFKAGLEEFPGFLDKALPDDPLKCEFFLPNLVQDQIDKGRARVRVLRSVDKWYGVTYKEDREDIVSALQSMKDKGLYPDVLWKK